MDAGRIRGAEALAGLAGVALLVSLFLPWSSEGAASLDGWESLSLVDLIAASAAALGVSLPLIAAGHEKPDLPITATAITCLVAIVATLLLLYRLADPVGEGREVGLYLGLGAALALAAATWRAMAAES